jgi:hypothetical protein
VSQQLDAVQKQIEIYDDEKGLQAVRKIHPITVSLRRVLAAMAAKTNLTNAASLGNGWTHIERCRYSGIWTQGITQQMRA